MLALKFILAPIFEVNTIRIAAIFLLMAFFLCNQLVDQRQKPPMLTDFVRYSISNCHTEVL